MIHHVPVPHLHTAFIVFRRKNFHTVRLIQDDMIGFPVTSRPADRLIPTGNGHNKFHIRKAFPQRQRSERGQGIKTQGAPAQKGAVVISISLRQGSIQQCGNFILFPGRQEPVTGKASCSVHESILSTARNASLGTCTVPN